MYILEIRHSINMADDLWLMNSTLIACNFGSVATLSVSKAVNHIP